MNSNIILTCFCLFSSSLHASEFSQGRYVFSGITTTVLAASPYPIGGVGHLIQGRWLRSGWGFTLSEPLVGLLVAFACLGPGDFDDKPLCLPGLGVYYAIKIYEVYDIWFTPTVNSKGNFQAYSQSSPFVLGRNSLKNVALKVTLQYTLP